jgi:hypothetical protein
VVGISDREISTGNTNVVGIYSREISTGNTNVVGIYDREISLIFLCQISLPR